MTLIADKTKLKKISVDELQVGMFIVNLGRSWISHPFFRNQLAIDSPKKIGKLKKYGIQEVYIDPERGLDVPSAKVEGNGLVHSEGGESNPPPELSNKKPEELKTLSLDAPSPSSQAVETQSTIEMVDLSSGNASGHLSGQQTRAKAHKV